MKKIIVLLVLGQWSVSHAIFNQQTITGEDACLIFRNLDGNEFTNPYNRDQLVKSILLRSLIDKADLRNNCTFFNLIKEKMMITILINTV